MCFEEIDRFLDQWVLDKGLSLATEYKDSEVRSVVFPRKNIKIQIWIENLGNNKYRICCWDFKDKNMYFDSDDVSIIENLNKAFEITHAWFDE